MVIIVILAAILLPVLAAVKGEALKTACISNYKQVQMATVLYVNDYDDRLMLTNHQPTQPNSRLDRTWVQLLLPYITDFSVFHCPADFGDRPKPEATFDQDMIPGDLASRYYQASQRSNIGYNFLYLAPVVINGDTYQVQPRFMSEVSDPAQSMLFIDTVYELVNGAPTGGGSYLAIPPCRYQMQDTKVVDTFFQASIGAYTVLSPHNGWTTQPDTTFVYGGAWPWHLGRMTVVRLDGSASTLTPEQVAAGCAVQSDWQGLISDSSRYIWRIRD